MKFAHILDERERTGPVRLVGHYIKYRSLKKLLKGANAGASAEFLAELDCEIARTCDVVQAEQKEIARLQDEVAQLRRGKAASSPRDRVILEGALWKRISELRSFVETAYETVYKAVKKHDKITKIALMDSVLAKVDAQSFMHVLWSASSDLATSNASSATSNAEPGHSSVEQGGGAVAMDHSAVPSRSHFARRPPAPSCDSDAMPMDAPEYVLEQLPWDSLLEEHPELADTLLAQFDAALSSSVEFASAALRLVSPELEEGGVDWAQRLTKLVAVTDAARARVHGLTTAPSSASFRQLHEAILAHKLELLRYMIKAVMRSLEHVSPDGAAALELVLEAHFAFFSPIMRPGIRPPRTHRVNVIAAMRRGSRGACLTKSLRRLTIGSPRGGTPVGPDSQRSTERSHMALIAGAGGTGILTDRSPQLSSRPPPPEGTALDTPTSLQLDDGAARMPFPTEGTTSLRAATADESTRTTADLLLRRGSSRSVTSPRTGGSLRELVRHASIRELPPQRATLSAAKARTALPLWKQFGLAILGVGPRDAVAPSSRSDARFFGGDENEDEDEDGSRGGGAWTWAALRSELWRMHRPAIMSWLPGYSVRKHLAGDVVAGLTIGIVLIPQGMAYATLAGLPPVYGLYTGLPAIVYACFGSSYQAAIGPMSIPALLLAAGVASMDPAPRGQDYIEAVMSISLLTGLILFALGFFNMGFLVRFASRPVLSGFTMASAMLTIASTAKDLLGIRVARSQVMYTYVIDIATALPQTSLPTLATSVVALLLLALLPRWRWTAKVPASLQVVALAIIVFSTWHVLSRSHVHGAEDPPPRGAYLNPAGIPLVGFVPSSIPAPHIPSLPQTSLPQVFATTFGIILVGFVESIAVAKKYAQTHGYEISATTELKAIGLANIAGSLLGSFPASSGFSRSSLCDGAGAKTPLNGVVSAITVLVLLFCITPALYYLPSCVLGAMIVMAVAGLIDFRGARDLWLKDKRDFLTMLAALIATLMLGVMLGVVVAMAFSLVLFLAITTQPTVEELGHLQGTTVYNRLGPIGISKVPDVLILKFLAPLFFANCSVLKDRALAELKRRQELPPKLQWRALVLNLSSVTSIDSTSIQMLDEVLVPFHALSLPVVIAGLCEGVERALLAGGFVERLGGRAFVVHRVHDAVRAVLNGNISPARLLQSKTPTPAANTVAAPVSASLLLSAQVRDACLRCLCMGNNVGPHAAEPSGGIGSARSAAGPAATGSTALLRSAIRSSRGFKSPSGATIVPLSEEDGACAISLPTAPVPVTPSNVTTAFAAETQAMRATSHPRRPVRSLRGLALISVAVMPPARNAFDTVSMTQELTAVNPQTV